MSKRQLNLRIDPALYLQLQRLAGHDHRSLNNYCELLFYGAVQQNRAVLQYMAEREARRKPIEE